MPVLAPFMRGSVFAARRLGALPFRHAADAVARCSEHAAAICALCAQICKACADECAKHEANHCKAYAQACLKCAQACRSESP